MVLSLSRLRWLVAIGAGMLFSGLVPGAGTALADPDVPYAPLPPAPNDFRRGPPYTFRGRGGAPRERLLGNGREGAWVAEDGVTAVTGGGSAGSLLVGGANVPLRVADLFDASFAPDMRHAALAQARTPLTVIDVPSGAVLWQAPEGRTCKARWMSPTVLIAHDYWQNARLWRIDFATHPPRVQPLGGVIKRADACWASPDGRTWLVRDDYGMPGGVVWVIDGLTGAASVLTQGYSFVVGSPIADRACVQRRDNTIDCIHVNPRTADTVFRGGTRAPFDVFSNIDDTGARLMFGAGPNVMVADFASRTVRAVPAITLPWGGSLTLLSGGHVLATGSSTSADLYDLEAGWWMSVPIARSYTVKPVWHRPRSVLVARQPWVASPSDLYFDEVPP